MKMTQEHIFAIYPDSFTQFRPQLSAFPTILNVTGDSVVGNGSGYKHDAVYGAYGEYVERYHFYNEIKIDRQACLKEALPRDLKEKWNHVIQQMKKTGEHPDEYSFHLTSVRNIYTDEKTFAPTVVISLSHAHLDDRRFIHFIDSCGQSSHVSREQAFSSAFWEFIERQALIGSWLSGKAKSKISYSEKDVLHGNNPIFQKLSKNGEITMFDLDQQGAGYVVIVFYFAKNKSDLVQYSVGMAADADPCQAMSRAINELWQSYTFMYLNAGNKENLDSRYQYLNELIEFNTEDTKAIIPFFHESVEEMSYQKFTAQLTLPFDVVLSSINRISKEIFAYESQAEMFGKTYYFCKILSPDYFLHMGIKMPLNFKNSFTAFLGVHIEPGDIKNPLPFP